MSKIKLLFNQAKINTDYRKTTVAARQRKEQNGVHSKTPLLHVISPSSRRILTGETP